VAGFPHVVGMLPMAIERQGMRGDVGVLSSLFEAVPISNPRDRDRVMLGS